MHALRALGLLGLVLSASAACRTSQPESQVTVTIPAAPATVSVQPVGSALPQPTVPPPIGADKACTADSECTVSEIGHEIRRASDCMCLLGCPFIPMNRTTATRRQDQYMRLCRPGEDGHGQPCPIDDCAAPPTMVCASGVCTAKR